MRSIFPSSFFPKPVSSSQAPSKENDSEWTSADSARQTYPAVPDDFLWGSDSAPYQNETGLHNSDWWAWRQEKSFLGMTTENGDNPDVGSVDFAHLNADGSPGGHFKEYLAAIKAMGQNSFSMALDWSRIQPTRDGPYDVQALKLYHAVLDECRKVGLEPIVGLQHFVLPLWAYDPHQPEASLGGWAGQPGAEPGKAPIVDAFAKFSGDMAREYGQDVKYWVTIVEPMSEAAGRYLGAVFPGPKHPDFGAQRDCVINMAYAHARAYDAIHAADATAKVGMSQHVRPYQPLLPFRKADVRAAQQQSYYQNQLFLDAVTQGRADWNADGKFDGPLEDHRPELANRLDWLGINYYTRDKVLAFPFGFQLGGGGLKFKGAPITMIPKLGKLFKGATGDDENEIYPEGMYQTLSWAKDRYNLPIIITENGIADGGAPDRLRPQFLSDHVAQMQRAMKDGADVRGYCHWAAFKTFEWQNGWQYDYGLLRVDSDDPARPFQLSQGAKAYSDIIEHRGVDDEVRERWGQSSQEGRAQGAGRRGPLWRVFRAATGAFRP